MSPKRSPHPTLRVLSQVSDRPELDGGHPDEHQPYHDSLPLAGQSGHARTPLASQGEDGGADGRLRSGRAAALAGAHAGGQALAQSLHCLRGIAAEGVQGVLGRREGGR